VQDFDGVPRVACPACGKVEPRGYLGERSGEVVVANRAHFTDRRGYLHCQDCGVVWGKLYSPPVDTDLDAELRLPAVHARGSELGSWFDGRDSMQPREFMRLARQHIKATHGEGRAREVLASRIYDAEALCSLLELPPAIRAAVLFHLRRWSESFDLRELVHLRRPGVARHVRAEAAVIATVLLVLDRFLVDRPDARAKMLAAFTFRKAPHHILPDELDAAFVGLGEFFGRTIWDRRPAPRSSGENHAEPTIQHTHSIGVADAVEALA